MAKNLIIYYSRTGENYVRRKVTILSKGNTEIVAEYIQKAVGGDLFRVETVKTYPADYYECIKEAKAELDITPSFDMKLSDNADFQSMELAKNVDEAIKKVEG